MEKGFEVPGVEYEADAVFLDVPNPEEALGNVKSVLNRGK